MFNEQLVHNSSTKWVFDMKFMFNEHIRVIVLNDLGLLKLDERCKVFQEITSSFRKIVIWEFELWEIIFKKIEFQKT